MLRSRNLWFILVAVVVVGLLWGVWQFRNVNVADAAGSLLPESDVTTEIPQGVELVPARMTAVEPYESSLVVRGRALPGKRVSILGGEGDDFATITNAQGAFELIISRLPDVPSLYRLEMQGNQNKRQLSAQGLIIVPGEAPLYLAAEPGQPVNPLYPSEQPAGDFIVHGADYDRGGGIVFRGWSGQTGVLRVLVGPTIIAELPLEEAGLWAVTAETILPPQPYRVNFALMGDADQVLASDRVDFTRHQLSEEDFDGRDVHVLRDETGTVVSWMLPGGGWQHSWLRARPEE